MPLVTPKHVDREGIAMVCHLNSGQNDCVSFVRQAIDKFVAHNPPPRRIEVTITPDLWALRVSRRATDRDDAAEGLRRRAPAQIAPA